MTVTISKMSAGKGCEYLLRTVASGDGDRSLSTPLTRYYTAHGTPPGRWLGSGIASLESRITVGDEVTEEQLRLLIGEARHPVTGQDLGRRHRTYEVPEEGKRRHPVADDGRRPRPATIMRLRQRANLAHRPGKQIRSLSDLTALWRRRVARGVGEDAATWARRLTASPPRRLLRADDIPRDVVEGVGRDVVAAVGEKRATWRRANLHAEASRQTIGWRFATTIDREAVIGLVVDAAERGSLRLTPPELATTPETFLRTDGTSSFRPKHSVVFSSEQLLAAEDRLLQRAGGVSGPTVDVEVVGTIAENLIKGHRLSPEQAQAIVEVAVSGRPVDLLIGPAGAGKTTAMRALHRAWTQQHGRGSVIGLAPSAAAAQVLAGGLGIACENTTKWLYERERRGARFQRGQLVIIDEATLAGTFSLDRITAHAAEAGAKVLLVGDWAQLQSKLGERSRCSPTRATTRPSSSTSIASPTSGRRAPPSTCATAAPRSSTRTSSTSGSPTATPTP